MSCEFFRQFALDHDWDESTRNKAAQTLQHLETCAECQHAIQDYDRLRQTLGTFMTQGAPPAGWDAFTRQVTLPSPAPAPSSSGPVAIGGSRFPSRWRIAWTAIAASIFIAASVAFELGQAAARPVSFDRPGGFVGANRAFSPPELPRELDDFSQLSNFYEGRLGWMLRTNSTTDTGLAHDAQIAAHDVLVLRLTLTHGPELTSSADLLIIAGQAADVSLPARHGPALHYHIRTSASDPTRVAIALELTAPTASDPLATIATNLQLQPGEKITAGRLATANGEYELNVSFAYPPLAQSAKSE